MSGSKHIEKIAWIVTAITLCITILFMNGASLGIGIMARTMGYETRLFDNTRVHTIDIVMDDWDTFIANAATEEYYAAAVVIDGEAYKNVGIRGKGNTSLSNVASMDSDRYSFKIEFDQYDSSISYHGLDKLSLNNLIQDNTMMKDYLTYTMMNEFGVAAPLCSFAYITVNGEDWGLYLAVEGVEDSFLQRNYGTNYGELYKPDSMDMGGGRGNGRDFEMPDFTAENGSSDITASGDQSMTMQQMPDNSSFDPSQMQGGFRDAVPDAANTDVTQMPGMTQSETGNADRKQSFGSRMNISGFALDEVTLREAFEKLGLDQSILDGVDFDNITMETMQSVLASLDADTLQQLMQEIMGTMMPDGMNFGGMGGRMSMGSSDVKLQYVDDSIDSYSSIWTMPSQM